MPAIMPMSEQQLQAQFQEARNKVFQTVNRTLIELYWNMVPSISSQVKQAKWGKAVVKQLAQYIQQNEPEIKGFSDKNLWRMKQFYEIYQGDEKPAALWQVSSWA